MKINIEFTLPEEEYHYKKSLQGIDLAAAFSEFDNYLRTLVKYGHDFNDIDDALTSIRKSLHDQLNNRGINIYE